jgi:hypothetical protein
MVEKQLPYTVQCTLVYSMTLHTVPVLHFELPVVKSFIVYLLRYCTQPCYKNFYLLQSYYWQHLQICLNIFEPGGNRYRYRIY